MRHIFHLKCSCGQERHLSVADMPPQWLEPSGRAIRPQALAIMKCLHCGKRGAPAEIECLPEAVVIATGVLTPLGHSDD